MEDEQQQRQYTGSWIPAHVMLDAKLRPLEKLLYAEIASFQSCFMSNEALAIRLGVKPNTVTVMVRRLKAAGYIKQVGFDGRRRYLKAAYDSDESLTTVNTSTGSQSTAACDVSPPIDNSIENKEITVVGTIVPTAPKRYGREDINDLFDYWAEHTGIAIVSRSQANRNACSNLVKQHGCDGVKTLIRAVSAAQNDRYAPGIADFEELQSKANKLAVWAKKKRGNDAPRVAVIA